MMTATTYTSVEAKHHFGRMIDTVQHEPITITKHNRDIAVVLSTQKVRNYAHLLNDFFLEQVEKGNMTLLQALDNQAVVEEDAKQAEIDYTNGNCEELTPQFLSDIREMALSK